MVDSEDRDWLGRLLLPVAARSAALLAAPPPRDPFAGPPPPPAVTAIRERKPAYLRLIRALQGMSQSRTLSAHASAGLHRVQVLWTTAAAAVWREPFDAAAFSAAWRALLAGAEGAALCVDAPRDSVALYSMLVFVAWVEASSAGTDPVMGEVGVKAVLRALRSDLVLWRDVRLAMRQPVRLFAEERGLLAALLRMHQDLLGTADALCADLAPDPGSEGAAEHLLGEPLVGTAAARRALREVTHEQHCLGGMRGAAGCCLQQWGDGLLIGGLGEVHAVAVDDPSVRVLPLAGTDQRCNRSAVTSLMTDSGSVFTFQRCRRVAEWRLSDEGSFHMEALYAEGSLGDDPNVHARGLHLARRGFSVFALTDLQAVEEWDRRGPLQLARYAVPYPALSIAVCGRLLVVGSDGAVILHDAETRALLREVCRPCQSCWWLVPLPGGSLISIEGDRIFLWDTVLHAVATAAGAEDPDADARAQARHGAGAALRWAEPSRDWREELLRHLEVGTLRCLLPEPGEAEEEGCQPELLAAGSWITAACVGQGDVLYVAEHGADASSAASGAVTTVSRIDVGPAAERVRGLHRAAVAAGEQVVVPSLAGLRAGVMRTPGAVTALCARNLEVVAVACDGTLRRMCEGLLSAGNRRI
eukprot:TRINITY_DN31772_c0_g1_i4.p1 TRINITY_DN31772_c0_g1~~TRINITY_DN31772_c0_g1_i4.p1  ORF type:complete len:667 (+),score=200.34 TRINITY_DN31772_c0_g1_i4:75-2003(+)